MDGLINLYFQQKFQLPANHFKRKLKFFLKKQFKSKAHPSLFFTAFVNLSLFDGNFAITSVVFIDFSQRARSVHLFRKLDIAQLPK